MYASQGTGTEEKVCEKLKVFKAACHHNGHCVNYKTSRQANWPQLAIPHSVKLMWPRAF